MMSSVVANGCDASNFVYAMSGKYPYISESKFRKTSTEKRTLIIDNLKTVKDRSPIYSSSLLSNLKAAQ